VQLSEPEPHALTPNPNPHPNPAPCAVPVPEHPPADIVDAKGDVVMPDSQQPGGASVLYFPFYTKNKLAASKPLVLHIVVVS